HGLPQACRTSTLENRKLPGEFLFFFIVPSSILTQLTPEMGKTKKNAHKFKKMIQPPISLSEGGQNARFRNRL
ncbi:MAG TPA: hypothetical protein PLG66_11440, partial [Calditrichia bacterium]|nr:hypothetical protein [Calditrichia bacterium]